MFGRTFTFDGESPNQKFQAFLALLATTLPFPAKPGALAMSWVVPQTSPTTPITGRSLAGMPNFSSNFSFPIPRVCKSSTLSSLTSLSPDSAPLAKVLIIGFSASGCFSIFSNVSKTKEEPSSEDLSSMMLFFRAVTFARSLGLF